MTDSADVVAHALERAVAEYQAGRMGEADRFLNEAEVAAQDPPYRLWEIRGAIALAQGRAADAAALLSRAAGMAYVRIGSDLPHLRLGEATALELAEQFEAALEALAAARTALQQTEADGTVEEARRALRHQIADVDRRRAQILWRLGRHDGSISAMVLVADEVPEDAAALASLARMMAREMRLAEGLVISLQLALQRRHDSEPAIHVAQYLGQLGHAQGAADWYRHALTLAPDDADARAGLAAAGSPAAADGSGSSLAAAVAALAATPADATQYEAAALRLLAPGQVPQGAHDGDWTILARGTAILLLQEALRLDPGLPQAAERLATALMARKDLAAAEAALRAGLKRAPLNAHLHAALGEVQLQNWRLDEASQSFRAALALQPEQHKALVGLATAMVYLEPGPEALDLARRALAQDPVSVPIRGVVGVALGKLQRPEEALEVLQPLLDAGRESAPWHFAAATSHLVRGDFAAGWPEYAWRWRMGERPSISRAPADSLLRPDPETWRGKTVLLYAEQGQGDTIQFLRYARPVADVGARVLLEVQGSLKSLATLSMPFAAGVFAREEGVPAHDMSVPMLHLPWAFGTTIDSVPATVPYLRADLARAASFRRRMQGLPGLKVGLVWSGDPRPHSGLQSSMDRRRSLTLASLAPLAGMPGAVFVSLQKGAPAEQAATPPAGMILHDWTAELEDFAATAALMMALDLVITVDTATAHLAGALGRAVWLLNRFDTDWRWLLNRDDSPWYPTMRLFRQTRSGEWDDVVQRVAAALREKAG